MAVWSNIKKVCTWRLKFIVCINVATNFRIQKSSDMIVYTDGISKHQIC